MLEVSVAAARVVRGPMFWIVAGVTRGRNYQPGPEGLMYLWWKRGGDCQLYRPCIFDRVGIPGSGGDDYLRADWEYVIAMKRPGKLPWSDNTAMGHIPKWAPGGEMSHRLKDGVRVNKWGAKFRSDDRPFVTKPTADGEVVRQSFGGSDSAVVIGEEKPAGDDLFGETEAPPPTGNKWGMTGNGPESRCADGKRRKQSPSSSKNVKRGAVSGYKDGDTAQEGVYVPPVPPLTLPGLRQILTHHANATKANPGALLQDLRDAVDKEEIPRWLGGIIASVPCEAVLQCLLHGQTEQETPARIILSDMSEDVQPRADRAGLLQPGVSETDNRDCGATGQASPDHSPCQQGQGKEDQASAPVRKVRRNKKTVSTPQGREPVQQRSDQLGSSVQSLPCQAPSPEGILYGVWESPEGARLLRESFGAIQEAWRPIAEADFAASSAAAGQRLGGKSGSPRRVDGTRKNQQYHVPVLANPGNSLEVKYTVDEVRAILAAAGVTDNTASQLVGGTVGGGMMGSPLAHLNEAPYPEWLCEFFVRSFCPEGGIVADCFGGSFTTGAVALKWGRRFVGCDLRQSQIELGTRRLNGEKTLFDQL